MLEGCLEAVILAADLLSRDDIGLTAALLGAGGSGLSESTLKFEWMTEALEARAAAASDDTELVQLLPEERSEARNA